MIITQLTGGLGNQLFQYAAAKALSSRRNSRLYIDDNYYKRAEIGNDTHRSYGLDSFKIGDPTLSLPLTNLMRYLRDDIRLQRMDKLIAKATKTTIINESNYGEKSSNHNIYMTGYYQSQKYFQDQNDNIRSNLKFQDKITLTSRSRYPSINGKNSVAIHIRRGDYLQDKQVANLPTLTTRYYQNAIEYLSAKVSSPTYYIFSDDINWCKSNISKLISSKEIAYVDDSSYDDPASDMQLMSMCDHVITANSSFSWWGAWLNNNENKIVIALKNWFRDNHSNSEIVPHAWVRL